MATRTIAAAGGNYGDIATWVEGVVPTAADAVVCLPAGASGALVVNVASVALSVDFTNYTNTFSGSSTLMVSGSVTLVAAMAFSYTGILSINATGTLTSAGKTITGLTLANPTITLADAAIATTLTFNNTTIILNGSSITCTNLIATTATSGTTTITATNWSGLGQVANTLTIATGGSITGGVGYGTGTLTLTNSTINTESSTITIGLTCTLNTNGCKINNITCFLQGTITNNSVLNVYGTWLNTSSGVGITINGSAINLFGNLTHSASVNMQGTSVINIYNTIWLHTTTFEIRNTINVIGNLELRGAIYYSTGTLTINRLAILNNTKNGSIARSLTTTASTTFVGANRFNFSTITITGGITLTMRDFFDATALIKTRMQSSNSTNFVITFQDRFEKISKFVQLSNATITNRNQLLIITDRCNRGNNIGVRYTNTTPNGVAKNTFVFNSLPNGIGNSFMAGTLYL